ncbi:hypothetical protein BH10BAC1_BH10BAC1_05490 [soil metagenome]
MTKEEIQIIFDKIKEGFKEAIAEVYEDARKNGTELVISKKPGEVQVVKVNFEGSLTVVRTEISEI